MKLLPQFSIRLMLGITALAAAVFSIVGLAVRGNDWAVAVSLGVVGVAMALITYAMFFGILWGFSVVASPVLKRRRWVGERALAGTTSPFADAPQVVAVESAVDAIVVEAGQGGGEATDSVRGERQS